MIRIPPRAGTLVVAIAGVLLVSCKRKPSSKAVSAPARAGAMLALADSALPRAKVARCAEAMANVPTASQAKRPLTLCTGRAGDTLVGVLQDGTGRVLFVMREWQIPALAPEPALPIAGQQCAGAADSLWRLPDRYVHIHPGTNLQGRWVVRYDGIPGVGLPETCPVI